MALKTSYLFERQYALVQSARLVLLAYCEALRPADFTAEIEGFGRGSISNLLVHIIDTYHKWLGVFGLSESELDIKLTPVGDVAAIRAAFTDVDALVARFLATYSSEWVNRLTKPIYGHEDLLTTTPLALFTHVITHEFHHKGQVLSMSRQLGYVPVDTDVVLETYLNS